VEFPANIKSNQRWLRSLIEQSQAVANCTSSTRRTLLTNGDLVRDTAPGAATVISS
jgi:hypothetical protein